MIRDLFIYLQGGAPDAAAVDAAIALAKKHEARVVGLAAVLHPVPVASEWGLAAAGPGAVEMTAAREAAKGWADAARERLERAGVPHELRMVDAPLAWPEEIAALHARHADLSLFGGAAEQDPNPRHALGFDALLMHGGRPVLLVPPGTSLPAPVRHVCLAWQPRREATRALHDALPLLAPGARVDVAVVDAEPRLLGHGERPGSDIAAHLARHGLDPQVLPVSKGDRKIGLALVEQARESGAELLVMGGFSHSRWRQQVFGGVTRTVLAKASLPVLFSH
ncbi:MAG TPA: universal stress protein [Arenimonas sp.]|nr:universal stress protein [Arenimonas sp.]